MPLFDSANPGYAREMQARAAQARRRNAANHQSSTATEEVPAPQAGPLSPASDGYVTERLSRLRAQLDRIDARIKEALDAQELDAQQVQRLAQASASLEEQERRLAGRRLPATLRAQAAARCHCSSLD
jgi:hypothetical protein